MLSRSAKCSLFLAAFVLVPVARLAVWLLPFRWLARTLGQPGVASGLASEAEAAVARQAAWAVEWVARAWLMRSSCLVRASALQWLLHHRRIPATVHLGTRRDDRLGLRFHAWVTLNGEILGRPEAQAWRTINTFAWSPN